MDGNNLVNEEKRRRKRNNTCLQREEEDRCLIAEGEGPRRAKTTALKNATWLEAEGRKRPRPRSPSADNGKGQQRNSKPGMTDRQPRKKLQKESCGDEENDEGHKIKKSQETTSSKSTKGKPSANPTRPTIIEASDESSSATSDLSGSDNNRGNSESNDSGGEDSDADGEDDDFGTARMTEGEVRQMFDDKMPQDAASLFDIENDDDIEMASIKSHHNRHGSSLEPSCPPTSESEGVFDANDDNDNDNEFPARVSTSSRNSKHPKPAQPINKRANDDDDNDDDKFPARVSTSGSSRKSKQPKAAQRISKRDVALQGERPKTLVTHSTDKKFKKSSSAVKPVESDAEEAVPEDTWPKALRLRPGALTQQTDLIRATCRDTIRIVENMLVTQHAWPELHQGALYKRQVLLDAVKSLRAKDTGDDEGRQKELYKSLLTRISRNEQFVRSIGKWVVDRLSHHRGQMRSAASDHIAIFQLGVGDVCAQRVQALIENDVYIYPGHWATDKDGKPVWMARNSVADVQIYLNPGLIDLIKTAFFNGPTAFRYKFKKHYVTSHPDRKEPELTIPVVALGATAFFAALYEWREGKKAKMSADSSKAARAEKFKGDNFKKVYDRHVETLTKLKMKVNAYHQVMSSLYSKVIDGDNAVDTGALAKGSALAVLDLDGLD